MPGTDPGALQTLTHLTLIITIGGYFIPILLVRNWGSNNLPQAHSYKAGELGFGPRDSRARLQVHDHYGMLIPRRAPCEATVRGKSSRSIINIWRWRYGWGHKAWKWISLPSYTEERKDPVCLPIYALGFRSTRQQESHNEEKLREREK